MGEVRTVLASDEFAAGELPYAGRLVIEDNVGETVHLHIGHLRMEFSREQFLWFADRVTDAADALRVEL